MPYQSKDWKMNDIIKEEDLDRIEQGLQETSILAENNTNSILNIEKILNLTEDSTLKNYIDSKANNTLGAIPLIDSTLKQEGQAADAYITGENFETIYDSINLINSFIGFEENFTLNLNNRLQLIENNEALLSIEQAKVIRDEAAASAESAARSATEAAESAKNAADSSIEGIKHYLYWDVGDKIEKTLSEKDSGGAPWVCQGYISGSSTGIFFTINTGKAILANQVKISNLKIYVRSYNGYIEKNYGESFISVAPAVQRIACPEAGIITVRLDKSNGWHIDGKTTKTANNRPCAVSIETITIEFMD